MFATKYKTEDGKEVSFGLEGHKMFRNSKGLVVYLIEYIRTGPPDPKNEYGQGTSQLLTGVHLAYLDFSSFKSIRSSKSPGLSLKNRL